MRDFERGSPYTPHTAAETEAMLAEIGVDSEEELFDIPPSVGFDGSLDIPARSEQAVLEECADILGRNDDVVEFLGRGHYGHFQPAVVEDLAGRSEFLTSYTQYQPEIAQGFLQALFEYQSIFVELTGLPIVNSSMYDAATALGEAATLATRVQDTSGDRVILPERMIEGRRSVLENYVDGIDLRVDTYPMVDGRIDPDGLAETIDDECVMVYVENPSVRGVIDPHAGAVADLAADHDALSTLGSGPVALSVLEEPASLGMDVVIGDAGTMGLPTSYGMGLGLFATREQYLRQLPGRIVGATEDAQDRRTFTLTLQTREQHIRRERATSNICTNQAWVALRTAMHLSWLGADGLVELARTCLDNAQSLAAELDALEGVDAPVHDGHHFREFVVRTERWAPAVAEDLLQAGYAVHVLDEHELQVAVTDLTAPHVDDFVEAFAEVTG